MEYTRTYTWHDTDELMAKGLGLSGLEVMQRIARREIPGPPVGRLIGVAGLEVEKGKVGVGFEPQPFHYNSLGTVHGGVIATALDIVLGSAVQTTLKAGYGFTTLTLELKYHRAVSAKSGKLKAIAEVVTRGRDIVTAEAKLVDARERLFATATSTLMIFALPVGGGEPGDT
ncbi:MAG: hotdog fold thioesterase [Alphaproteobacteria bacterium]|nr:hotdog fold thioesterase [Alphaproteobacteria bacterium]